MLLLLYCSACWYPINHLLELNGTLCFTLNRRQIAPKHEKENICTHTMIWEKKLLTVGWPKLMLAQTSKSCKEPQLLTGPSRTKETKGTQELQPFLAICYIHVGWLVLMKLTFVLCFSFVFQKNCLSWLLRLRRRMASSASCSLHATLTTQWRWVAAERRWSVGSFLRDDSAPGFI